MKTDVLFVHHQLAFAVSIKQALERTGSYDVHPFTSVEAALEYLRGHAQDVALVDFMMPVYSGEEIVERLRQVQAGMTVVATPTQTEAEFARLGLHGMLSSTFTAREFIPVIERALEGRRTGELPTTAQKAGLLDRVQPDAGTPEKRPPTSVIGYRSLESILDQGGAEPKAPDDAPTLVEGLPAAPAWTDLSFMTDVQPPAAEPRVNTDKLADMDKFQSDEFPELADEPKGIITDSLKGVTAPLPDDLFDTEEDEIDTPVPAQPPAPPPQPPAPPPQPPAPPPQPPAPPPQPPAPPPLPPAPPPLPPAPPPLPRVTSLLPEEDADFEQDVFAEPPAPPPLPRVTSLLPEEDAGFDADMLPEPPAPPPLPRVTSLLPEEDAGFEQDVFAEPPAPPPTAPADVPWSEGGYGTRPLPDMEFEEDADEPQLAADAAKLESLSAKLRERDLFGTRPLEPGDDDPFNVFGSAGQTDVLEVFDEDEDAPGTPDQPVDYMAALQLNSAAAEPPEAPAETPSAPSEDEMVAGLMALFDGLDEAPPGPDLSFDALLEATGQEAADFAAMPAGFMPDEDAGRGPSAFDELVASMGEPQGFEQQDSDIVFDDELPPPDFLLEDEAGDEASALLFEEIEELGGDTPSEPALPTLDEESPEPASSEELAALFAAPDPDEALVAPPEPDFEAQFPSQPTISEAEFNALFASPPPASDSGFDDLREAAQVDGELDFEGLRETGEDEDPADFEAMFAPYEAAEAAEQPDFDRMFGEPQASPFPPGFDIFSDDWQAAELVDVDESASFEETGTVSDLMSGVGEVTGGRSGMLTHLDSEFPPAKPSRASAETTAAPLPPIDDSVTALLAEIEMQLMAAPPPAAGIARETGDDSGDTPARRILAASSEAELADSSFSVDHLLDNIEAQMQPNQAKVQPLPSWLRTPPPAPHSLPEQAPADETLVHAPAEPVMPDALFAVDDEPPFDWDAATFDDTTVMGAAARLEQFEATGDEETSWLEFIGPDSGAEADETLIAGEAAPAAAFDQAFAEAAPEAAVEVEAEAEAGDLAVQAAHIDDPYIAQLALSLTDVSLELTADAVLLTRDSDIAAFAGRMGRAELLELRQVIDDDWAATSDDARIRFLRLPESGKDVMLYSRRTVEELTLSLVFDGAMPLRDIRQQGKRLTDALAAVPEAPVDLVLSVSPDDDDASAADLPAIPRSPHAYVWLLRNPEAVLARQVAQAILNGIHQQMHEHGWRVQEMRAGDDHIYLLADSPDEQPPYMAVRELMRRSAQIAHAQNPALDAKLLWADAYLVVTPGRLLDQEEIQQFIQFERML